MQEIAKTENFARNSNFAKFLIFAMHSNFCYDSEKTVHSEIHSCGCCSSASCNFLLAIFLQFSSCFEILHSWLAEIDMRPYEIDGNQPDFGYDWIDKIIWPPIPAKTTKTASECN